MLFLCALRIFGRHDQFFPSRSKASNFRRLPARNGRPPTIGTRPVEVETGRRPPKSRKGEPDAMEKSIRLALVIALAVISFTAPASPAHAAEVRLSVAASLREVINEL